MQVDNLMTRQVHCCRTDETLQRAAQLLWDHDCGCLPACDELHQGTPRVVGIITDRDICMCALFTGKPLSELRVRDAMTRQVLSCRPHQSLMEAEGVMRGAQIRRLPVVDEHGGVLGMLSLADLARQALRDTHSSLGQDVSQSEIGDTLGAICMPPQQSSRAQAL
jgi:CBS domain-containing protein